MHFQERLLVTNVLTGKCRAVCSGF